MNKFTDDDIVDFLWDHLEKVPGHADRCETAWGRKTKRGLVGCIRRLATEQATEPVDVESLL